MSRNKDADEHYLKEFLEKPAFIPFPKLKTRYKDLYYSKDEVERIKRQVERIERYKVFPSF